MKKLNLDTTINHNTLTLDLNSNFKLFAFISTIGLEFLLNLFSFFNTQN
jgi:hypothetical protein